MISIDYLKYEQTIRKKRIENKINIWDPIRRKFLVLLPEELVRQLVIQYLITEKNCSKNKISIERSIKVNGLTKRCDILAFSNDFSPFLLVECKAPSVNINEQTFRQIAWYNMPLKVPYLLITNGLSSYCCQIDFQNKDYIFLDNIPEFP